MEMVENRLARKAGARHVKNGPEIGVESEGHPTGVF